MIVGGPNQVIIGGPNQSIKVGQVELSFPFHAAVGDNYLAQANVTGSSPHRAVEAALGPLRRTLDVANFHCHESAFEIAPVVWLETDGRSRAYSLSVETGGGLKPQHLAVERVKELRNEGVIGRLPDRLIASLEQHSIAYSTSDPKVRFTNLWAALETLTGKAVDETIVDRITRCVVPMIVHRRPSKVIKYLAICLQEFGLVGTYTDESRCFTRSKASFVRPDELLLALTGAMGDAAVYELLSFTSGHSLLCNRISREAETFHDPKLLSKQLADSERRTCWQLLRIYRARNLLIHAGHRGEFLEQLLSNLEAYYSLAVGRVISDLRTNVGFGVDESFESRRMRLDYVRTQLQRAPSVLTVLDLLPEGDNDSTAPLPWPPAS